MAGTMPLLDRCLTRVVALGGEPQRAIAAASWMRVCTEPLSERAGDDQRGPLVVCGRGDDFGAYTPSL